MPYRRAVSTWALLVGLVIALPGVVWGVLNVASPRTTLGWQMTSTAKRRPADPRYELGTGFQRLMGISKSRDPMNDVVVLRRIRMLGVAEIVFVAGVVAFFTTR